MDPAIIDSLWIAQMPFEFGEIISVHLKCFEEPGFVSYTCNPTTQGVQAGGSRFQV